MPQVLEFAAPADFFPSLCAEMSPIAATAVPEPPSMPSALLRMELLLKQPAVDLGAICDVIRNDIGLTVGLLRLANSEGDLPTRIPDLVLCLGVRELRSWVRQRALLGPACRTSRSAMAELTRHSRLVARAAEVIARFVDGAASAEAYSGAMLHDIGALPGILGWNELSGFGDSVEIGLTLARDWQLPAFVLDAIQPQRESCPVSPLGQAISAAVEWTDGVEQALRAGLDTYLHVAWSRSIVERWLPLLTAAESARLFEHLDSCIEPWLAQR